MRHLNKGVYVLIAVSGIIAVVAYPFLPETIPIHWNAGGEIDNMQNRIAIFLIPLLLIFVVGCFLFSRHADPHKKNYEKFSDAYQSVLIATELLMIIMELISIVAAFEPALINVPMVITICLGMVFAVMGNVMPKIRENYFIGIRTPWTLSDADVWRKTHRIAGKLWFTGGVVMLFGAFLPPAFLIFFVIIATLILAGIPVVYSYVAFQRKI